MLGFRPRRCTISIPCERIQRRRRYDNRQRRNNRHRDRKLPTTSFYSRKSFFLISPSIFWSQVDPQLDNACSKVRSATTRKNKKKIRKHIDYHYRYWRAVFFSYPSPIFFPLAILQNVFHPFVNSFFFTHFYYFIFFCLRLC